MPGVVTASILRDLMNQVLLGDSELDAFVIDHFPHVQRLYAGSMDRIAKVNLLFERVSCDQIYANLRERYPSTTVNSAFSGQASRAALVENNQEAAQAQSTVRYFLVLTGTIDELDEPKLRALVSHIRKLAGDAELTLEAIKSGSIILHFKGTAEGLARLRAGLQAGELQQVLGYPVERVEEEQAQDAVPLMCSSEVVRNERDTDISYLGSGSPDSSTPPAVTRRRRRLGLGLGFAGGLLTMAIIYYTCSVQGYWPDRFNFKIIKYERRYRQSMKSIPSFMLADEDYVAEFSYLSSIWINAQPESCKAKTVIGFRLKKQGYYERATEAFLAAFKECHTPQILLELGETSFLAGDYEGSRSYYRKFLAAMSGTESFERAQAIVDIKQIDNCVKQCIVISDLIKNANFELIINTIEKATKGCLSGELLYGYSGSYIKKDDMD